MVSTQQVLAVMVIPGVTWISRVSMCPGHGPRKAGVLTHAHPAPVSPSSMGTSIGVLPDLSLWRWCARSAFRIIRCLIRKDLG